MCRGYFLPMLQPPPSSLLQTADDGRLFLWTGEFRDRRVEQMYRQQRLEPVRTLLQACGLAATTVFFLLIIRQYMLFGIGLTFWLDAAVRSIGLIIGVIFQILVRRAPATAMLDVVGGVGMATLTTLTFMTWLIGLPPALNAGTLAFGYLLVFFLLVPCPAQVVVANAIYLTVGTAILGGFWLPLHSSSIFSVVLFLGIGNGLGIVGMRQFKLERRRNFLAREEARRVTEALTLARQEGRRRNEYQAWALDALQVGVMLFHPGGEIHSLNRRANELLALPPGALHPGDTHETLMRFLLQRRDFGDMELSDVRYHIDRMLRGLGTVAAIRHATTGKILEFTLNRLPDESVAVTIFDATERYALNRRLRHAVEVAGDGFAIYDSQDRIAAEMARLCLGAGMKVLAWNRSKKDAPEGVTFVELDQLLNLSHVVSIHLLLNDETRGFLSADRIARMRPGAILVNTARGAVVDEDAMIAALKSGQIGAAGLDVFNVEPLPKDHPLTKLDNVTLSAHSAFRTPEASENLIEAALNHTRRIAK
jgi:PAS domain-containing protein